MFFLKDGLDQPCDVSLVVRYGEFKAHRKVLSEASPFFEKLLNSDMKECKEGVVRLEIFTDSLMRSTLEFIYTGNVQILDEDEARNLNNAGRLFASTELEDFGGPSFISKM